MQYTTFLELTTRLAITVFEAEGLVEIEHTQDEADQEAGDHHQEDDSRRLDVKDSHWLVVVVFDRITHAEIMRIFQL